jgi:hypothetical protein
MRMIWLVLWGTGCAYISDKHEDWRLDPDGDGFDITSDCDDENESLGAERKWYVDKDEDGYGDPDDMTRQCTRPAGFVLNSDDCDDTDAFISPSAGEVCDGLDNDCNGVTDDDLPQIPVYEDADGDGFGAAQDDPETACEVGPGQVENGDDCDDSDPTWLSAAPLELFYNGIDDNCDSADLDGDKDGDGFWAEDYAERVTMNGGEPMVVDPGQAGDCDDADAAINPDALEVYYDGVDSDCDKRDDFDQDRDGYAHAEHGGEDCNDFVDTVHPGAEEDCSTDHDDDCNGSLTARDAPGCRFYFEDSDDDGYGNPLFSQCWCLPEYPYTAETGDDCNDFASYVHPDACDSAYDGIDANCEDDDDFDQDRDGYRAEGYEDRVTEHVVGGGAIPGTGLLLDGDCDDSNPLINPAATETCLSGDDEDCDGSDNAEDVEGCEIFYGDFDGDGYGDALDSACWCGPSDTHPALLGDDCDDADPLFNPGIVDTPYDALDTDCAGDDDFDADGDGYAALGYAGEATLGVPGTGELSATDCDDFDVLIHPEADELCDLIDNNCDGLTDGDDAIDRVVWYADADEDGFGDEAITILACSSDIYVDNTDDCEDNDSAIHPGADEFCDEVDQDCDGDLAASFSDADGDGLPDCIDPPLISDVAASMLFGISGTDVGASMNIDSDGRVAIGAPQAIDGSARVYVLDEIAPGTTDLEGEEFLFSLSIPEPTGFGRHLATLPELEGDGTALVVSSPFDSAVVMIENPGLGRPITWPPSSGEAEIWAMDGEFLGITDGKCGAGLDAGNFATREEEGEPVLSPGLVVGCTGIPAVYVLSQEDWIPDGMFSEIGVKLGDGVDISSEFGQEVASGDFNGDGIDDVAVGTPRSSACGVGNCGSVYLFDGPHLSDISIGDRDGVIEGSELQDQLGFSVTSDGDLDFDGVDDLMVETDRGWSPEDENSGTLLIFSGPSLSGTLDEASALTALYGTALNTEFGSSVAVVPDLDGDFYPELVLGAPKSSVMGEDAGAVYGMLGPWAGGVHDVESESRVLYGSTVDGVADQLGTTIFAGDAGLDGTIEILISAVGSSRVYAVSASDWLLD